MTVAVPDELISAIASRLESIDTGIQSLVTVQQQSLSLLISIRDDIHTNTQQLGSMSENMTRLHDENAELREITRQQHEISQQQTANVRALISLVDRITTNQRAS